MVHVLRSGGRWKDCPAVYGPPTTVYNRFHRWARRGFWQRMLEALAAVEPDDVHLLDSTTAKAHRSAAGGKGGPGAGDHGPMPCRHSGRSRGGRTTKIHAVVDGQGGRSPSP